MALQAKYPFLEALSESEAMARGANLDDKINYTVYNTIKGLSTSESVRAGSQFTLDTFVPDILNLTKNDLTAVVRKLVVDRLVVQIFRLVFEGSRRSMQLVPCFLAAPAGERDTTFSLWGETNLQSVAEIEKLLAARLGFDQKGILADLTFDLKSEKLPKVEELPHILVDFFSAVHAGNFDIVPPQPLLPATLDELKNELGRRRIAVELPDYGFMPLPPRRAQLFELAGRFLTGKIVPRYKSRGNLKGELQRIQLEESRHHEDGQVPQTTEFTMQRADAVKKALISGRDTDKGIRFPGALTIEIIQRLGSDVAAEYEEAWRERNEGFLREFIDGLNGGDNWQQMIRILSEKDLDAMPPVARDRLLAGDGMFFYETYMHEDAELHVFVRRDIGAIRALVEGMQALPAFQQWQILALRAVIEKNEYEIRGLFDDSQFVASYGRLLRLVYQRYFPWYLRLLLGLGLTMFQDSAFKIAKLKIQQEQKALRDRLARRRVQAEKQKEEERKAGALRVRDATLTNQLIDTLDELYLEQNKIPTVDEARLVTDMAAGDFNDIINRGSFQKIKLADGGQLLLYPLDHNWRSRVARLRRTLDRVRAELGEDAGEQMGERIRKLEKHLTATESAKPESQEGDAYAKFGRAVREHEARTQESLDVDFSDDLEV